MTFVHSLQQKQLQINDKNLMTCNRLEFCPSTRESTNACVPRDVSRGKHRKFSKCLKNFKIKTDKMNVKDCAAFFAFLAFTELPFTVTSFTGEANSNKRKTRALA